jgi:hypothetical protein
MQAADGLRKRGSIVINRESRASQEAPGFYSLCSQRRPPGMFTANGEEYYQDVIAQLALADGGDTSG